MAPDREVVVPELDEHQQRVVDHEGGPLLVLAGPGTGKTTTLVEAIVDRIEQRGATPDSVLALTFSRKAAEQLRDRVTARVARTTSAAACSTFHSFAYALVRKYAPAELYEGAIRLLSAPEADVVLRELLRDNPESVVWPEQLRRAAGTRGFVREVQAVLARAREKGLDPAGLRALGIEHDLPELIAAGLFLEQYLTVLDNLGATDYADLIRRAVIEAEAHRDELRARYAHVFVDEYQDTDPGQVALLRAIAGDGRNLTVVGDPHQSIYGFRGADVRGILDFPGSFPTSGGSPAPVVVLRRTRRFGPRILLGAGRVAGRLTLTGSISAEAREAFLSPEAVPGPQGDGRVEVVTYDTERAEAERLADLLRRAHLEDGIAWDRMAVLVRSGRTSIPPLRRALAGAGVPVEVASDDLPLVHDPAVLPLLGALRAVVNLDNDDPDSPDFLDPGRIESLLLSPLGGLDASDLRALVRRLRTREKELPDATARRTSRELLRLAVVEEGFLEGLEGHDVERAADLAALLHAGARMLADRSSVEDVLWHFWSETSWPQRLRRQVDLGGAGARRAHRDLDAIVALFELASRVVDQREHIGVKAFFANLVEQQLPADTLAEQGARGKAVRLLTAHRSKGLEWDLVVVAHVQQEGWPDLRRRTTLLGADRIGVDASGHPDLVPPVTARALLMEERRLFYVACTRARRRLVVSAVKSPDDDGEQPSRFLEELGVTIEHHDGRPARPLSLGGLVAELRRHAADPSVVACAPRGRRPPPGGARGRGGRRSPARADRRPVDLVGHPQRDPVDRADPRPRAAGPGLRQHARLDPALPRAVVLRARGRRRLGRAPVRQPRPDPARPRRARGRRRAAGRGRPDDGRGRGRLGPARLPHAVVAPARARPDPQGRGPLRPVAPRQPARGPRRRAALPERRRRRRPPRHAHRVRRPARDRRLRPRGRRRLQERPGRAVRAGRRGQPPARALPVRRRRGRPRRGGRSRPWRPAGPSSCSSASTTTPRAPRSRASRPTTRTVPSARCSARGSPARPPWCAPRTSPRRPARTAATARSSPSARPRAQGA